MASDRERGDPVDPITSAVLILALGAVFFYTLYAVVRRAVAAGIRDAANAAGRGDGQTRSAHTANTGDASS